MSEMEKDIYLVCKEYYLVCKEYYLVCKEYYLVCKEYHVVLIESNAERYCTYQYIHYSVNQATKYPRSNSKLLRAIANTSP